SFRRCPCSNLTSLEYHNPSSINSKDKTEFRDFIIWLKDQKIRYYNIEDRGNLRIIHSRDVNFGEDRLDR
uniref:RNA transcription, translation and transport factor protein n=1 Tax=Mus spicilegus TaxID=10103 RepID=A0A8C6GZ57_MUSSI